jgi:NodT family efflux transporter outer membrane factor (OMF) lipoprotein
MPSEFTSVTPLFQGEIVEDWWRAFGDPALDAFVEAGLAHNSDLTIGAARLLEARAIWNETAASRWPFIGVFASAARERGLNTLTSTPPTVQAEAGSYGGQASFEVDLWGRLQAASEAARRRYLAQGYTLASLRIAITAELVRGYLTVQALHAQREILSESVTLLTDFLRLSDLRYRLGNIPDLDVQRARAELEDSKAQLATATQQAAAAQRALVVLAGALPTEEVLAHFTMSSGLIEPSALPAVPLGVPSDLLSRRPDLRAAEANLAAAQADLAVAKRALLPSLSLTGSAGEASPRLSHLFSQGFGVWSIGGDLTASVFDGGRKVAGVHAADARRVQILESYRNTVRNAFKEVLDALDARAALTEVHRARGEQTRALERSVYLAQRKYDEGYSAFLDVLDARRTLLQSRLAAASARSDAAASYVDLVVALGGGWNPSARFATAAPLP